MSYDYNDHPTVHLVEGLFAMHQRAAISAVAYNYGKDDDSDYAEQIRRMAREKHEGFMELALLSNRECAQRVWRPRACTFWWTCRGIRGETGRK
jgi:hypothetical protein